MKAIDSGIMDSLRTSSVDSLLKAKKSGRKIIGMYCAYCPRELIIAAGAIPIGDLPPSLRSFEVLPLQDDSLERLLRYVR